MTLERKYERDIDVLLAEEFDVSPAFAQRFWSWRASGRTSPGYVVQTM